ncbi:manganese-dependent inorganic pyrophosphatase [Peptoniphilus asaccharolyticus DSM 20463]|uniref:inorganic diphosphatase n=1 Tax=Peptoniphilus asaccharolyticus DSM 20463 TaxID=573058 RepID=A0A1W1UZV2_PEPAS|nr:putative manganese-dependent inorganic diphosphatase [Peptoniphilus asaccharolyticus]MBL7575426.1 putative manganese-dependent inorganic diphosphatase [Peptoniphilus asaccharolyticus]SMB86642.1 manganese-dependent inorganic pyrophosphatase [Peptoniphilus asaccharolyticus DSM 20463]
MKDKYYVTGHKNPDTDSICAAIAYAELKRKKTGFDVEAIRLGELNQETKFVLDYFGVKPSRLKDTIQAQVKDLEMDKAYCVSESISLYKALQLIQENGVNSLPITDQDEKLLGIASLSNITMSYMDVWDDSILGRSNTSYQNILEVLAGKFIYQPEVLKDIDGKITVYAMSPEHIGDKISKGDIIILGDRKDAQLDAMDREVSLIIVTGGFEIDGEVIEKAKATGTTIISTNYNTFMAGRLLPQAVPISHVMTNKDLVTFDLEDTVEEVKKIMGMSRFRSYPVLDNKGRVIGSIGRFHLISGNKKQLILVDHNEKNQSIDDIDSAVIREIIDHHRVANIATDEPVYFRNEPVGSTCTIVAEMYYEAGIMPSREIAGLLSAAIISDTLLFKSPTATETDKRMLDRLSKVTGIDHENFAMEMFREGTKLENKSMDDLVNGDVKKFVVDDESVRVCQIFTMNLDGLGNIEDGLKKKMEEVRVLNGEATFVMMLTDIFKEISEVIVVGEYVESIKDVFGATSDSNSFKVPGLLSRKKQLIPNITRAIQK